MENGTPELVLDLNFNKASNSNLIFKTTTYVFCK